MPAASATGSASLGLRQSPNLTNLAWRLVALSGHDRRTAQCPLSGNNGHHNSTFADCKSVFWKYQSLFAVKISLLLILGNLRRNDDEPLGICSGNGLTLPKFAKFPVKFPVSRECGRRLVRSALARQPTSLVSRFLVEQCVRKPANTGHFARRSVSEIPEFEPKFLLGEESLSRFPGKWPFCRVKKWRLVRSSTEW